MCMVDAGKLSFWDAYAVNRQTERYITDLTLTILARTGLRAHPAGDADGRLALVVPHGHGGVFLVTEHTQTNLPAGLDVTLTHADTPRFSMPCRANTVRQTHELVCAEINRAVWLAQHHAECAKVR